MLDRDLHAVHLLGAAADLLDAALHQRAVGRRRGAGRAADMHVGRDDVVGRARLEEADRHHGGVERIDVAADDEALDAELDADDALEAAFVSEVSALVSAVSAATLAVCASFLSDNAEAALAALSLAFVVDIPA